MPERKKTVVKVIVVDDLDEAFHGTAKELLEALKFAESDESHGEFIEACGEAVTIARKLIAIEDALQERDEGHEDYSQSEAASA